MSDFQSAYRNKKITHEELVARMKPGDLVILGTWLGQPRGILHAIGRHGRDKDPIHLSTSPAVDADDILFLPHICSQSTFLGASEREARKRGKPVLYTPLQYTDAHRMVRTNRPPEYVAVRVAPMDSRGYFNLSLTSSWQYNAMRWLASNVPDSKLVVEVNRHMPRVHGLAEFGNHEIHVKEISAIVEDDTPLMQYPTSEPTDTDRAIAANVAALIEDRATIQLGIGSIPMMVGKLLAERKELGIHSEMFCQAHVDLIEAGSVTNAHKGLYDGVSTATFALGEDRLYRWVADNPKMAMLPVEKINSVTVLARLQKMTAINSLLNIDMAGQGCAHCLGHETYSGVGGAFEFAYGAQLSPGGRSIHCFRSTTQLRDGREVSNIVFRHQAGTRITIPEHAVDWVVTEFGAARLKFLNLDWRARALIDLAHPRFREELTAQAEAGGLHPTKLTRQRRPPDHFFSKVSSR